MSAVVKLSTKLPGDQETNGLDARAGQLLEEPDEPIICIAWVDTQKVTIDTDSGDHVPTARIRRIEPIGGVHEIPEAIIDAVSAAVQKRTGRKAIPFAMATVEEGYDPEQSTLDEA